MKLVLALLVTITLVGCGGFDKQACFESAESFAESLDMTIYQIPGEDWRFIAVGPDSIAYLETMATSHCNLTQVNVMKEKTQ